MRLRIRGPGGQSTVTLDDATATVATLRQAIERETTLHAYAVKHGYPPKHLALDDLPAARLLTDLGVKLDGEQLLISPGGRPTEEEPKPRQEQLAPSRKRGGNDDDDDDAAPEVAVPELGGLVVLRIMPDDNSCLFRAVASAVMSDVDAVVELRAIVADAIQADGGRTYTRAVLDNRAPDEYCRWIRAPNSWGGQVELVILARYFDVEIFAIDVQHLRVDRYNEGARRRRCLVVYSGIHYDSVALSVGDGDTGRPDADVRQFDPHTKDAVLAAALDLCGRLRDRHYYTDTAGFRVRCGDCGAELVGERGAAEHARRTGHYNFGEAA